MANRKISKEFMTVTVASVSTEAPPFTKENMLDRTSPQKHWRSNDTSIDIEIVIDMQTNQSAVTTYLDWCNFETFRYRYGGSASGPWNTIGIDRTIEKDPMHGVYRRRDELSFPASRYLNITIPGGQTTTDGATYYRVGTLAFPTSVAELDAETTVEYPFEVALPESHIVENRFPGGKTEKIRLGQVQSLLQHLLFASGRHLNTSEGEHEPEERDRITKS